MAEHEPLTEDECEIAFDLWALRLHGQAGAVKPECLPAAVALCELGWLERRWHGDNVVFWFTDAGLAALNLNALRRTDPADLN